MIDQLSRHFPVSDLFYLLICMSQRIVEQVTILCVQTRAYPSSQRQNCIFNTGLLIKEILVLYCHIFDP